MFNNYIYLLRGIIELKKIICGGKIVDIYTQEKDKLFLRIPLDENPDFTLILSTQPQFSYLLIKPEHKKAKKNTREFFQEHLPTNIVDILISKNDRIIKFVLSNGAIYFHIRSVKSNVIFFDNYNFQPFKKIKDNSDDIIFTEIKTSEFIRPETSLEYIINDIQNLPYDAIINKYRFLDKSILKILREDDWKEHLLNIINKMMTDKICVPKSYDNTNLSFFPASINDKGVNQEFLFESYFDALSKFISLKQIVNREKSVKKELEKYLIKELEKISNKLNDLKAKIEIGSNKQEFSHKGHLLLTNIHQIKKGMDSITLYDNTLDKNITIQLDKTLSPSQNIDKYFEKSKNERVNYQNAIKLYGALEAKYNQYKKLIDKINSVDDYNQLLIIKKEIGIKSKMETQDKGTGSNFKHFIIENKYHVFVGKNSKNNDELTTRFAKQNDLWFHARGVSGSHVVLRVDNSKEPIPKSVIRKAASIAAYFSKAKTSKLAPVSYTFKKYVTKRKDLEPGQVILLKEDVILVPPEIPNGGIAVD